jgi:LPS sulfotransferase NodH
MRYTEADISSKTLDQRCYTETPKKLFILSTPRSGSYFLCRHMINAGLGVPHEYFNPIVMRLIAPRLSLGDSITGLNWWNHGLRDTLFLRRTERRDEADFLVKYTNAIVPIRCQNEIFAAKIHYRDYRRVLDNGFGHRLFENSFFIHLYRGDMLRQAISEYFAQLTGKWGIDEAVTTQPHPNPDFFDVAKIDDCLNDLSDQDRNWRVFLARNGLPSISISYEQLCRSPNAILKQIACLISVDAALLRPGYIEEQTSDSKPDNINKEEARRRYLASVPKVRSSRS